MSESINQNNKLTVTIAVPAHNEEATIGQLLRSLIRQKTDGFALDSIVVLCDGCTDRTAEIVRSVKSSLIRITGDSERKGKIGRLNELYRICSSDIIITIDADVVVRKDDVIAHLVDAFHDKSLGLASGLELPLEPRTFQERIFKAWTEIWYEIRKTIRNGAFVHNHAGCISAVHQNVFRNLVIPNEVIADDEFLFFETRRRGLKFKLVPESNVYYRLPSNFKDYFLQSGRYLHTRQTIVSHFGPWTEPEYHVALSDKIRGIVKISLRHPFLTICALATQVALRLRARFLTTSHTWDMVQSTKGQRAV